MIDWLATLISPRLGAGTGTIFSKLLSRKPLLSSTAKANTATQGVSERIADLEEREDQRESRMALIERDLRRMRGELRALRVLVDVLLVLGLGAGAVIVWWRYG